MKKTLPILLICIAIIGVSITLFVKFKDEKEVKDNIKEPVVVENGNECIIKLIRDEKRDGNPRTVLHEENVKAGTLVNFDEYGPVNNIRILEIMDDYVRISSEKVKYKIVRKGEAESYLETIEEEFKYGEEIQSYINDYDPYGPNFNMPLGWDLFVEFEKSK